MADPRDIYFRDAKLLLDLDRTDFFKSVNDDIDASKNEDDQRRLRGIHDEIDKDLRKNKYEDALEKLKEAIELQNARTSNRNYKDLRSPWFKEGGPLDSLMKRLELEAEVEPTGVNAYLATLESSESYVLPEKSTRSKEKGSDEKSGDEKRAEVKLTPGEQILATISDFIERNEKHLIATSGSAALFGMTAGTVKDIKKTIRNKDKKFKTTDDQIAEIHRLAAEKNAEVSAASVGKKKVRDPLQYNFYSALERTLAGGERMAGKDPKLDETRLAALQPALDDIDKDKAEKRSDRGLGQH